METIILRGDSKESTRLLMQLARQLKFKARKLSLEETEEIGLAISIHEGLKSGLLDEKQKEDFIQNLKSEKSE